MEGWSLRRKSEVCVEVMHSRGIEMEVEGWVELVSLHVAKYSVPGFLRVQ